MSSERDIEKLARDVVRCAEDGLRPQAAFVEDFARAYLAERQRADDLAKRERELRECVKDIRERIRLSMLSSNPDASRRTIADVLAIADALLAKEPE